MEEEYLPRKYKTLINPGNIPDGHCNMCAFNTYLAFKGIKPKEAGAPGSDEFKLFGDWFYYNITVKKLVKIGETYEEYVAHRDYGEEKRDKRDQSGDVIYDKREKYILASVSNEDDTSMSNFKQKTKDAILGVTKPGQCVLLSIDDGTHWFTAVHMEENNVVFIDSQKGIGFNIYSDLANLYPDTNIDIIDVPDELIEKYITEINPTYERITHDTGYGKRRKSKRKSKRKPKKKTKRKSKRNSKL